MLYKESNEKEYVDDQISLDDLLPGPSSSKRPEQLQKHKAPDAEKFLQRRIVRVDDTSRLQVTLIEKNGHRWSAVPKSASKTPQRNILHIFPGPVTNYQN